MQTPVQGEEDKGYAVRYVVKRTANPAETQVVSRGVIVGRLSSGRGDNNDLTLVLADADGRRIWIIDPRVGGQIRPFSLSIWEADNHERGSARPYLTIKQGLFNHKGKFYSFGNTPEGRPHNEFLTGKKCIARLDNFPFTELDEVDIETLEKLRRYFRGPKVGEVDGLGLQGHRVSLSTELKDIGLLLAASSYLLYSTA